MARVGAHLRRRARWRWRWRSCFWLGASRPVFALPSRAAIINEVLVAGLFALSLDLILGLTGIVSLGHAAFLGLGAYAAGHSGEQGLRRPDARACLRRRRRCGSSASSRAPLLLRGGDLTRLMVTLGVSLMLGELANRNGWLTGGADGLNFSIAPVFGLFPIDLHRAAQRGALQLRGPVHFVCDRAPRCALALRAGAGGDPGEPPARRARLASTPAAGSLRSMRLRRPTRARRARCWRRQRRSCRSTCSTSIARPTSC